MCKQWGYKCNMKKKTEVVRFRLTDDEMETFSAASEVSGLSLSAWIRERLRKISRQELGEAGEEVPLKKKPKKE